MFILNSNLRPGKNQCIIGDKTTCDNVEVLLQVHAPGVSSSVKLGESVEITWKFSDHATKRVGSTKVCRYFIMEEYFGRDGHTIRNAAC